MVMMGTQQVVLLVVVRCGNPRDLCVDMNWTHVSYIETACTPYLPVAVVISLEKSILYHG
jgi:hypothetical protein